MKRRITALMFAILLAAVLVSGCGKTAYNPELSDLGGVFSVDFKDIDFSVEVSGKLTEGEIKGVKLDDTAEAAVLAASAPYTKVLRWGIARKPNNGIPAADPGAPELLKKHGAAYIGDTSRNVIYLTFDEGYENGYTPKILDVLRDNKVKAVFFITGPYLRQHADLVERMIKEGHEVGNHTVRHPSLPTISEKEMEEEVLGLDRAFHEKFGQNMKFLRPPKGEYSEQSLEVTHKLGYCNLFWSFAYDDWYRDKSRGADYAYNIVLRNLHNGAVLLLHAVSKDNAEALDRIIKGARAMGYEFGDPVELIPD